MSGKTSKSYFFTISFLPDRYFKVYIRLLSIFLLSILIPLFYEMHLRNVPMTSNWKPSVFAHEWFDFRGPLVEMSSFY